MSKKCPLCDAEEHCRTKFGYFVRGSDKRRLQRFRCLRCLRTYSQATFQQCYRQKKRRVNPWILELLCSNVSLRRVSKLLHLNRKTVVKKSIFLAIQARKKNLRSFSKLRLINEVQFDDLETIEHTKCKPLSVTLAIEKKSRQILGFEVSQMPAKGHLAKIALKKYGFRKDRRPEGRRRLFLKLTEKILPDAVIESDESPHYKEDIKRFFPHATHQSFLGKRSSLGGQGELKKTKFDPLFSINHTFAMLRANINRLIRKTWCTTKKPERLRDHIELYVYYHNEVLLKA
jgi:transposase-like protein